MGTIPRYETLIKTAVWGESMLAKYVDCKNDYCLIIPNSKFILPYLASDKNRHQEEN